MNKNYDESANRSFWNADRDFNSLAKIPSQDGSRSLVREELEKYDEDISGYHVFQNGKYSVIGNIKPIAF